MNTMQAPTHFNAMNKSSNAALSVDLLTVDYVGEARNNNDVGCVQANRPVPSDTMIYYFEVIRQ